MSVKLAKLTIKDHFYNFTNPTNCTHQSDDATVDLDSSTVVCILVLEGQAG